MELKLRYLEASITGKAEEPQLINDLPEFEKMSLQMMDAAAKTSLFNSIIKCLAGREVVTYFTAEKAWLKR